MKAMKAKPIPYTQSLHAYGHLSWCVFWFLFFRFFRLSWHNLYKQI